MSRFTEYSTSSSVIWRNERRTKWGSINPKTGLPLNVLGVTVRVMSPVMLGLHESPSKPGGPKSLCNGSVISTLSVLSIRPKAKSPEESARNC